MFPDSYWSFSQIHIFIGWMFMLEHALMFDDTKWLTKSYDSSTPSYFICRLKIYFCLLEKIIFLVHGESHIPVETDKSIHHILLGAFTNRFFCHLKSPGSLPEARSTRSQTPSEDSLVNHWHLGNSDTTESNSKGSEITLTDNLHGSSNLPSFFILCLKSLFIIISYGPSRWPTYFPYNFPFE